MIAFVFEVVKLRCDICARVKPERTHTDAYLHRFSPLGISVRNRGERGRGGGTKSPNIAVVVVSVEKSAER